MPKTDAYESELLSAFEKGALKSVATKAELSRLKAAARATAVKDRRSISACRPAGIRRGRRSREGRLQNVRVRLTHDFLYRSHAARHCPLRVWPGER